jgi:hypothetical protein
LVKAIRDSSDESRTSIADQQLKLIFVLSSLDSPLGLNQ